MLSWAYDKMNNSDYSPEKNSVFYLWACRPSRWLTAQYINCHGFKKMRSKETNEKKERDKDWVENYNKEDFVLMGCSCCEG